MSENKKCLAERLIAEELSTDELLELSKTLSLVIDRKGLNKLMVELTPEGENAPTESEVEFFACHLQAEIAYSLASGVVRANEVIKNAGSQKSLEKSSTKN